MKKILEKIMGLICITVIAAIVLPQITFAQPRVNASFQVFYDELSPYGQWVEEPNYGAVWIPSAGNDFRPYYTNGHWVMTEYGNTWVSGYPWGWAPFHYGRWTFDRYYGWVWIPGTDWGPAWVAWRSNDQYFGWAPMAPGISVSFALGSYSPPVDWWVFIPPGHINNPAWHKHYKGHRQNATLINNTTIINNTFVDNSITYITGPGAKDIKKHTRKDPKIYRLGSAGKPGKYRIDQNTVNLYRPNMERNGGNAAPRKLSKAQGPLSTPQPFSTGKGKRPGGHLHASIGKNDKREMKSVPQTGLNQREMREAPQKTQSKQDVKKTRQKTQLRKNMQQSPKKQQPKPEIRKPSQRPEPKRESRQAPQRKQPKQQVQAAPQRPQAKPEMRTAPHRPQPLPKQNTGGKGKPERQGKEK